MKKTCFHVSIIINSFDHLFALLLQALHEARPGFLDGKREPFPFGSTINGHAFLDVILGSDFDVNVSERLRNKNS